MSVISLETLREILSGAKTEHKNSLEASSVINEVWKEVLEYSEPERKKGKWTIKAGELAFWDVCSECKKMVIHKAPFYNFCPNCGADMREGEHK